MSKQEGTVTISIKRFKELEEIEKQKEKWVLNEEVKKFNTKQIDKVLVDFINLLVKSRRSRIKFHVKVIDEFKNEIELSSERSIVDVSVEHFMVSGYTSITSSQEGYVITITQK